LLQIGRLDRHKNYEAAIQSLALLPEKVKLVIVGPDEDQEYKTELLQLIENSGLTGRVIFAGVINGVDKFYLLKHALAYIHMAHSEGFGMVVQEAMSQGAICLISKGTGLEEIVKDKINGYALAKENIAGIAETIKFILENPEAGELKKIRQNNINSVKSRTWEKIAASIENLFNRAIIRNQKTL